jgi:diguanylate cyclase (GGDEF)-like protein/PAS domain S-box-containing protein
VDRLQLAHLIEELQDCLADLDRQAGDDPHGTAPARAIAHLRRAIAALEEMGSELDGRIDELRAANATVEVAQQRYAQLFEMTPDGYLVTGVDGVIREANRVAARMLTSTQAALVGKRLSRFLRPEERAELDAQRARLESPGMQVSWESRLRGRAGSDPAVLLSAAAVPDGEGRVGALRWVIRDISGQKRTEEQLRLLMAEMERQSRVRGSDAERIDHQEPPDGAVGQEPAAGHGAADLRIESYLARITRYGAELEQANARLAALASTDGLTELKNYRAFREELDVEFYRAGRYATSLSILMLDVDHFKRYNDTYGHPAGDDVLRRIATIMRSSARQADFVARYGGEEFVILLPQTEARGGIEVAERLRLAIEGEPWPLGAVTASIGVATLHPGVRSPSQLLEEADNALYRAKSNGRNCTVHASTSIL